MPDFSDNRTESKASQDFMEYQQLVATNEKKKYINMREALLDILVYFEEQYDSKLIKNLKKRTLESRSKEELQFIIKGLEITFL